MQIVFGYMFIFNDLNIIQMLYHPKKKIHYFHKFKCIFKILKFLQLFP